MRPPSKPGQPTNDGFVRKIRKDQPASSAERPNRIFVRMMQNTPTAQPEQQEQPRFGFIRKGRR